MKEYSCGIISAQKWELSTYDKLYTKKLLEEIESLIKTILIKKEFTHFIVAMQLGFPIDIAKMILHLQQQYQITLECAIPFENQHITWNETERNIYFDTIATCNKMHLTQTHFSVDCFKKNIDYVISTCNTLFIIPSIFPCDANDAIIKANKKYRHVILPADFEKTFLTLH